MGMKLPANRPCRARRAIPVLRVVASGRTAVTAAMARTLATMTARRPRRVESGPLIRAPTAWAKANAVVEAAAEPAGTCQAAASWGISGMVTYIWPTTRTPMTDTVATVAASGAVAVSVGGGPATDVFDMHRSSKGSGGGGNQPPHYASSPPPGWGVDAWCGGWRCRA